MPRAIASCWALADGEKSNRKTNNMFGQQEVLFRKSVFPLIVLLFSNPNTISVQSSSIGRQTLNLSFKSLQLKRRTELSFFFLRISNSDFIYIRTLYSGFAREFSDRCRTNKQLARLFIIWSTTNSASQLKSSYSTNAVVWFTCLLFTATAAINKILVIKRESLVE